MRLNVVHGLEQAGEVLTRVDPLDLSSLPETVVAKTKEVFGDGVTPEQSVARIIEDVRRDGDAAVRRYAKLLDGAELTEFRISGQELAQARAKVSGELVEALELAAQRIREFHQATLPRNWVDLEKGLGELVRPL